MGERKPLYRGYLTTQPFILLLLINVNHSSVCLHNASSQAVVYSARPGPSLDMLDPLVSLREGTTEFRNHISTLGSQTVEDILTGLLAEKTLVKP